MVNEIVSVSETDLVFVIFRFKFIQTLRVFEDTPSLFTIQLNKQKQN